jgi:hypothetical protein
VAPADVNRFSSWNTAWPIVCDTSVESIAPLRLALICKKFLLSFLPEFPHQKNTPVDFINTSCESYPFFRALGLWSAIKNKFLAVAKLWNCGRFLISPLGANFDPQGCSWSQGLNCVPWGEVGPQGEDPFLAPPFFYITSRLTVFSPGGERRGEHFPKGTKFIPRGQVHPGGQVHPWGPSSSLGAKLIPGCQAHPWGAKFIPM